MDCLTQDEALALVSGTAREPERLREHADTCPTCHALLAEAALALAEDDESPLLAADASSMAPLGRGSVLLDRFVILDRLGRGGMGTVWLAHDNRLRREVALKFVGGDRAEREARLLAAVEHPNVVAIHDLVPSERGLVLAMEYIEGVPIDRWAGRRALRRARRPSPGECHRRLVELAEALVAVHERGLVHGDVKPDNALIDRRGRTRLIDFGLASDQTGGGLGGTSRYLAPERLAIPGGRPTIASDLYALAATWIEVLIGERPAPSTPWTELLPRLPWALRRPLGRALAPDPRDRFADVAGFLGQIRVRRRVPALLALGLACVIGVATLDILERVETARVESCVAELWSGGPRLPTQADLTQTRREVDARVAPELIANLERARQQTSERIQPWRDRFDEAALLACTEPEPRASVRRLCLIDERERVDMLRIEILEGRVDARRMLALDWLEARAQSFPCLDQTRLGAAAPYLESLTLRQLGALRPLLHHDVLLAHLRPLGPSETLVHLEFNAALAAYARREVDVAWSAYERMVVLARRVGPSYREADGLWGLATLALRERSDPRLARVFMRMATGSIPELSSAGHRFYEEGLATELAWLEGDAEATLMAADRALASHDGLNSYPAPQVALAGLALLELGRLDEAERRFEELLALRQRQVPPRPERIAGALHNLALVALAKEEYERAGVLLDEALRLRIEVLGEDHPDVARVRLTRARWAGLAQFETTALEEGEAALDRLAFHLGPGHLEVEQGHRALAELALHLAEFEAAHHHRALADTLRAAKGLALPGWAPL